ncbi:uncharacterized protein LOC120352209 [Nilaparvata lugens]|uniref:uncharacterized protein LOC120352209 n=1 Tax=Nilaparvata lugens TaxID=108931 RepID=UPI00193D70EF|nr:uncharacterized protein LOC120352209 [Nilaparvata lugens]
MKKNYQIILVWLTALSLNVEARSIFDMGPFKVDQRQIGIDYCPISSKRCMYAKHHRRRIAGTSDWLWNGTLTIIDAYIKNTTTMRVMTYAKGANGRYQSLIDITRPVCSWINLVEPFINAICNHAGYFYKCYSLIPGIYEAKDFLLQPQKHFQLAGVPVLPYGSYKIEFRINNDIRINCFCGVVFIDLVEESCILVEDPSAAQEPEDETSGEHTDDDAPETGTPISRTVARIKNQQVTVRCMPAPALDMDAFLEAITSKDRERKQTNK